MKRLLEDCLKQIDCAMGDILAITNGPEYRQEHHRLVSRLKTAIAALSPDAGHAEAILAHADGLEDEGDARAHGVRAAMAGTFNKPRVVMPNHSCDACGTAFGTHDERVIECGLDDYVTLCEPCHEQQQGVGEPSHQHELR